MFLVRFAQSSIFTKQATAANHVPPTQRMIIMSSIRPAYAFVTPQKIITRNDPFSFILFYFRYADVLTSEIHFLNVAKTVYFSLFHVRPEDGTMPTMQCL